MAREIIDNTQISGAFYQPAHFQVGVEAQKKEVILKRDVVGSSGNAPEDIADRKEIAKELSDPGLSTIMVNEYIERMAAKLQTEIDKGDNANFDLIAQIAQMLIMATMRKNGANSQQLQEFAELEIKVLRDQILKEHKSKTQLTLAIISGGLAIVGGVGGLSAGVMQATGKLLNVAQTLNHVSQPIGKIGDGVGGFNGVVSSRMQGKIGYLSANKEIYQQQASANSDEKRRASQQQDRARDLAQKIRDALHQTILSFVRNNY